VSDGRLTLELLDRAIDHARRHALPIEYYLIVPDSMVEIFERSFGPSVKVIPLSKMRVPA
jgi:hypothetical protein